MADAVTQVPPDSTGDMIDMTSLTVGANTVHRQRVQLAGNDAADLVPADATAGVKVDLGVDNDVDAAQGTAAAGSGAWPVAVTNTADAIVKPGDSVNDAVRVNIVAGGGAGGTSMTDDAAFTPGSTGITPAGGTYRSVRDTLDDNDGGAIALNERRGVYTTLETPDSDSAMDDTADAVKAIGVSDDGTSVMDDANSAMRVSLVADVVSVTNTISTDNSTTATLGISGVFTGTGEDVSAYTSVTVQLDSSHDSATDGMTFQFSIDNTNWDDTYLFTYTAADGARRFQFPVTAQYFRLVYTNGGTGQTHFRVQTILHRNPAPTTIHRLVDNEDPDRSAHLQKSVIIAQGAGTGDFVPVQATASGNLKMALEEYEGVPTGGGTEAGSLRVTLPTDGTGVLSVDDNGTTLSVDDGGGTLTVDNATISVVGSGTEATAQRVTIATDSTGVLSVDDNGASLTVDNATISVVGGGTEATAQRVTIANDSTGVLSVDDNAGSLTVDAPTGTPVNTQVGNGTLQAGIVDETGASAVDAFAVGGGTPHDSVDSGNPVKQGFQAVEFDADPPIVSADGDRVNGIATPNGIQWVLGGHPNIISKEYMTTGAQTNDDMIGPVAVGSHMVITAIEAVLDEATSVGVQVRIGFGTTTVPAEPASGAGVVGMVLSHGGLAAGSGVVKGSGAGVIAVGGSDEELRITCQVPTGGKVTVITTFYIASL